jgi:hypothetical protein
LSTAFREEVLNVKLAELLSRRQIVSIPETLVTTPEGRRLPDVIIGEYWGVRVVIEGKVGEHSGIQENLEGICRRRIEEGIGAISIGVIYPPEIRTTKWRDLDETLANARLRIRVFTATRDSEWAESDLDGLSEILRRAYENLVAEDVVDKAVALLGNTIESTAQALAAYRGTEGRLREILIVPKSPERP